MDQFLRLLQFLAILHCSPSMGFDLKKGKGGLDTLVDNEYRLSIIGT